VVWGFLKTQTLFDIAQAKIQFNKQKKLEKLMEFAQKKRIITNSNIQKLLCISNRTTTRYLVKLAQQGRLLHIETQVAGAPRPALSARSDRTAE